MSANTAIGRLFDRYGSDKERNGYSPVYHALLDHRREQIRSLLEVGIGTMISGAPSSMIGYSLPGYQPGGSLRAWRDWLPSAKIVGIDIQPDTQFSEDRIETVLADSRSRKAVDDVLLDTKFDVIIDDGLYAAEAQVATLSNLLPRVSSGGLYVVEDVHPGSRFFELASHFLSKLPWFTTEKKNLVVIFP